MKKVGASGITHFTIMDVHLKPKAAHKELLMMRLVVQDFISKNPQYYNQSSKSLAEALAANVIGATETQVPSLKSDHPILIVGDFNADCRYISATRLRLIR